MVLASIGLIVSWAVTETSYKPTEHTPSSHSVDRLSTHITHCGFYDLLGRILKTGNDGSLISEENIYRSDESAFQTGIGSSNEKVIGAAGKHIQHQQKTRNRCHCYDFLVRLLERT